MSELEHRVSSLEHAVIEIKESVKAIAESTALIAQAEVHRQHMQDAINRNRDDLDELAKAQRQDRIQIKLHEAQLNGRGRVMWAIATPAIAAIVGGLMAVLMGAGG